MKTVMEDLIPGLFGFRHISGTNMEKYSTEDWQGHALNWHFLGCISLSLSLPKKAHRGHASELWLRNATVSSGGCGTESFVC